MDARAHGTEVVDTQRDDLVALSHAIHGDAEPAFAEHVSSARVAQMLDDAGFAVTHGTCGLDTAVVATIGSGPLQLALCAEYDALPGIGHACGHNIIAASAVGAALALAGIVDDLGVTVRVIGTPGEEGGGGKIHLLEGGAFDGLHGAMMVHPAPMDAPAMPCLAVQQFAVSYHGRAAHASAYPHLGINAADALTVAQVAIGLLRQHIRTTDRIHGIVTDGGDAPNIVPAHAGGTWYVRAATLEQLADIAPRVRQCFEAGATATGASVAVDEPAPPYAELRADARLTSRYVAEAEALGRRFDIADEPLHGSTDMGNVSRAMPAIHPLIGIDSGGAVNHQPEFAAACVTASADRAVRDGAVALARTVIATAEDHALSQDLQATSYAAS
ncbi:MAG: amidohydrolase [Nitriliruptoraceae bacterium]